VKAVVIRWQVWIIAVGYFRFSFSDQSSAIQYWRLLKQLVGLYQ